MDPKEEGNTAQEKEEFKQASPVGELFYIEDYEANLARKDIEKWPVGDIESAIWWSENGFLSYIDDELRDNDRKLTEEERIKEIFEVYEKRGITSIINDFLKVKYLGDLEEVIYFIEEFQVQEVKVSFYWQILKDLQYMEFSQDLSKCRKFLEKISETICLNDNIFQNIEICKNILSGKSRKKNLPKEYVLEEREKFYKLLDENVCKANDLINPIENYKGIKETHITDKIVKRLLQDLKDERKVFSREEIVRIIGAVRTAKFMWEQVRLKGIQSSSQIKEEKLLYELGSYKINDISRYEIVDLINLHTNDLENPQDRELVNYLNIRLAGFLGYMEFIERQMGEFYEGFEENQKQFALNGRAELLSYISDKEDFISWDIMRHLFDDLKENEERRTASLRGKYAFSSYSIHSDVLESIINSISKNFNLGGQFLRYCYQDSAATFDSVSRRLMWEMDNSESFLKILKEETIPPLDVYCSLLFSLSLKQLQEGEIKEFKRNIEEIDNLVAGIDDKNASLLLMYSISEGISIMDMFVNEEIDYPEKFYTDNVIKHVIKGRNEEERRSLSLYLNQKSTKLLQSFEKLLENREILDRMDLEEKGEFFETVVQNLLCHPSKTTIQKVWNILEDSLNQEMQYFRTHPKKMFINAGDNEFLLNQLFAELEIVGYLDARRDSLYKIDNNGEIRLSKFGIPLLNSYTKKILWPYRSLPEVKKMAERYAEFLVKMITEHREYNKVNQNDYNLKSEADNCLSCKNREISLFYRKLETRYLLNSLLFNYFERCQKEEDSKK